MAYTDNKLHLVFGDLTTGVHGNGFSYIFSYERGGLESMVVEGKEWMYRVPTPTYWRALTDNDRGCGFHKRSGNWIASDIFPKFIGFKTVVDGQEVKPIEPDNNRFNGSETADTVSITFTYETLTVPTTTADITYTVTTDGKIRIDALHHGKEGLPQLPVFGVRMIMVTKATRFVYEGLSGETYPDRMAGGVPGVYEVQGLPVTPYMVPQDCGMHMNTEWAEIFRNYTQSNADTDREEFGIRVEKAEESFAFSCLPYTAEELENATHIEELPPARRTVLCVYGAVRGVGGRDSWGTDVEEAYHIDATKDIACSFVLSPIGK